uniref:alanine--tRNA ligase n=1 Tax=Syphacia muris TaxID=451379 RepID=A0A0N5AE39_9BILA
MVLPRLRPVKLQNGFKCFNTMASKEVREAFFNFFKRNGHVYYPSSSLLPFDDPTLLFVNAGMNQFKSIFLGTAESDSRLGKLRRVYNSQKCLRAGGKTSDLSCVGRDTVHHSFFEMLGNWSFGDYYKVKKEACNYAWEFLTGELGLSPARLYVTYFGGDDSLQLGPDNETREIWRSVGLSDNRIIPFKGQQNFWHMGDCGPCGTCSEIHYNMESEEFMPLLVNRNGSSIVEIWNLVFLEYNRDSNGNIFPLPKRHVDCGIGFERISAIMQNVRSNYDTDIFQPLIVALSKFSKVGTYQLNKEISNVENVEAFRIIADHLRASCMVIADGVTPSGTGRGYGLKFVQIFLFVLRQMIRRASLLSETKLKTGKNILKELVPYFLKHLEKTYPEVKRDSRKIIDTVGVEENRFWLLITRGRKLIEEYITLKPDINVFPGAFFKTLYGEKRDEGNQEFVKNVLDMVDKSEIPITNDPLKYAYRKIGDSYDFPPLFDTAYAIINDEVQFVEELKPDSYGCVVFPKSIFYAEEGGQACDAGTLYNSDKEAVFVVDNVLKRRGVVVLFGKCTQQSLKKGVVLEQRVDMKRRILLMKNHTATHLLLHALREIFGPTVCQKGSSLLPDYLKFSCFIPGTLSMQQIFEVQNLVNKYINNHESVFVQDVSLDELLKLHNLQSSLEPYLNKTSSRSSHRVISINGLVNSDRAYAVECCCGTYVYDLLTNAYRNKSATSLLFFANNTGEIGNFQIISHKSVGAGVHRFKAITSEKANEALLNATRIKSAINSLTSDSVKSELPCIKKEMGSKVFPFAVKDELRKILKKKLKTMKNSHSLV